MFKIRRKSDGVYYGNYGFAKKSKGRLFTTKSGLINFLNSWTNHNHEFLECELVEFELKEKSVDKKFFKRHILMEEL